jgi:hypothetical protein
LMQPAISVPATVTIKARGKGAPKDLTKVRSTM